MSVLSHVDISREVGSGALVIAPFDPHLLRPNSYDWTLGPHIFRADKERFNHWIPEQPLKPGVKFYLQPDEFYLCSTLERFRFPNHVMGTFTGRSSFGRLGLMVHVTAAHVDAGYVGTLTGEVRVVGPWPVPVELGQNIGQIIFEYLHTPATLGYGDFPASKYMYQADTPVPSRLAWEPGR